MVQETKRTSATESRGGGRDAGFRWSVERRLAFVEERLFWLGEVNRADLVRQFGVSLGQASADIARYLALTPRGLAYDKSAKRYVAGDGFEPVLAPPDANRLLGELHLVEQGILRAEDTMLGGVPPFDAAPIPQRRIDAFVLRAVLRGIRTTMALDVLYQSMSRPEPIHRTIEPQALAHDGFRWHVRAFDRESGEFRDFVLGRISKPKLKQPARARPEDDVDWRTFVELVIAPHPGLTRAQARAIAIDYGIRGVTTTLRVRRALLFYALKRLGLDVSPETRPPHQQHIVLVNRDEIMGLAPPPDVV